MSFVTLLVEDVNGVRWLTVNRPNKLNALNREVLAELETALREAAAAPEARALVITGAGEKAFIAGADISEFVSLTPAAAEALSLRGQRLLDLIAGSSKPVIAAVNGFALGGGCELALACHLRLASTNATFGQPEVRLGLIPGYGGTQRLPRLVGQGRALELLLTGATIDATTALAWGLVNRVTEPGALRETVQKLAEQILAVSPVAAARCLAAVRDGASLPLERGLAAEAAQFGLCFASEDAREGTEAFLGKRRPSFPGR
jgi:enoyl-CoA hydratase